MHLEERARRIRLLILDCDGVLTDGGVYYDAQGQITKRFHVHDGLGMKFAQKAGLTLAVISGLAHDGVAARMAELGVAHYVGGKVQKLPWIENLRQLLGLTWEEIAYMGDDWVDAGPMCRAGLPLTVPGAQPEIKALAAWVSSRQGGHGAVREAIALILSAQGRYEALWQEWSE